MLFWILAGLVVYLLNVYLPAIMYLPAEGVKTHLGPRDDQPKASELVGRARRSLTNFQENLPVFLALGILAMIVEGANMGQAVLGAQIFVLARIAFTILYLTGIPLLRSIAWVISMVGLVMMALALI